jgi:hypothetical protein
VSLLFSTPPTISVSRGEVTPFGYDLSNALQPGDVVSSPSATVWDVNQRQFVPTAVVGQPTVAGTIVTVWFDGMPLVASSSRYRVVVTFTAGTARRQRASWISVPY